MGENNKEIKKKKNEKFCGFISRMECSKNNHVRGEMRKSERKEKHTKKKAKKNTPQKKPKKIKIHQNYSVLYGFPIQKDLFTFFPLLFLFVFFSTPSFFLFSTPHHTTPPRTTRTTKMSSLPTDEGMVFHMDSSPSSNLSSSFGARNSGLKERMERAAAAPFIIGVCGASASGKTSVCNKILDQFKFTQSVTIISLDSFYKELNKQEKEICAQGEYDFDSPKAFDWELLFEKLRDLKSVPPKSVDIPTYDFCTHSRLPTTTSVYAVDIVLLEGILTFHDEKIRDSFDMKIYVETDSDTCLGRRVIRDMEHRGRDLEGILAQYEKFVKPGYDNFVSPQKRYADIIIPRGAENTVAISVIVNTIKTKLQPTPTTKFRW